MVAGDTWWSFFGHGDQFGFVPHADGYTLHYPGDTQHDQDVILALRKHAFQMTSRCDDNASCRQLSPKAINNGNLPTDTPPPPIAPVFTGFTCKDVIDKPKGNQGRDLIRDSTPTTNCTNAVYWRGAPLAVKYDVQYLMYPEKPESWVSLCQGCVSDHQVPFQISPQVRPQGC